MMKKRTIIIGLLAVGVIIAGIATYGTYRSATAKLATAPTATSEIGAIADAALPAPNFQPQASDEDGITVTVTPLLVSPDVATWEFDVVMSTHAQELGGYDLTKMAALVDDAGTTYAPIFWQPDATEGHHVGGVLKFARPTTGSKTIKMKVSGIGNAGERVFQWSI